MYFEKTINKVWEDDTWIKHIYCEGSRNHVFYWTSRGKHCKEKNCIYNAPDNVLAKATREGREIFIFVRTIFSEASSSNPKTKTYIDSV